MSAQSPGRGTRRNWSACAPPTRPGRGARPPGQSLRPLSYLTITSLSDRLVDDEIGRLLRRQPSCFEALKTRVDDPVEIAELRVIGQEFGDLQQLSGAGERPGIGVAWIFELFGLDAEMRRRDRVIGVEIGVRSVAE